MEKIDEDIEELEIGSVRYEEAHVEQERHFVLPEVLPHDSHASLARWLGLCQDPNECMRYNIQMNFNSLLVSTQVNWNDCNISDYFMG